MKFVQRLLDLPKFAWMYKFGLKIGILHKHCKRRSMSRVNTTFKTTYNSCSCYKAFIKWKCLRISPWNTKKKSTSSPAQGFIIPIKECAKKMNRNLGLFNFFFIIKLQDLLLHCWIKITLQNCIITIKIFVPINSQTTKLCKIVLFLLLLSFGYQKKIWFTSKHSKLSRLNFQIFFTNRREMTAHTKIW